MSRRPKTLAEVLRTTCICSTCGRVVPIAPSYFEVACAHACNGLPCHGNEKRAWRDALVHPAQILALQHEVFQNDAYWTDL